MPEPLTHDAHPKLSPPVRTPFTIVVGAALCVSSAAGACADDIGTSVTNAPDRTAHASAAPTREPVPATCPTTAPPGMNRTATSTWVLCTNAVAQAANPTAAGALTYGFGQLGAAYTYVYTERNNTSPPRFDCSSFVGRAYTAAGATITTPTRTRPVPFYPLFGWTGAYMPAAYTGTELARITKTQLRPGDIIIQFNGTDPSTSAGAAGHATLWLGNNTVLQSSTRGVNAATYTTNNFTTEWYFRYGPTTAPATPTRKPVFRSSDAKYGTRSTSTRHLQQQLRTTGTATQANQARRIDGRYERTTRASVKTVQKRLGYHGKDADGILGKQSARWLGLTWKKTR